MKRYLVVMSKDFVLYNCTCANLHPFLIRGTKSQLKSHRLFAEPSGYNERAG